MGQAKNRGSKEERVQQAQSRTLTDPQRIQNQRQVRLPSTPTEIAQYQNTVTRLVENSTTPSNINGQVSQFTSQLSDETPIYLDCEPEPWSRQSCCDANVTTYMQTHGGRMICGYRIWYKEPFFIEGERHAVWTDGEIIKDVSFADSGETNILFVPDTQDFDARPKKVRFAFEDADKLTVRQMDEIDKITLTQMSPEVAWNTMPSYEQWSEGRRMENIVITSTVNQPAQST